MAVIVRRDACSGQEEMLWPTVMMMREAHEKSVRHKAKKHERMDSRSSIAPRCKLVAHSQIMAIFARQRKK